VTGIRIRVAPPEAETLGFLAFSRQLVAHPSSATKLVPRLSLVMALYEDERQDDCGADHHRQIIDALRAKDAKEAQSLMDTHLADIEGRVKLTPGQSERHSFMSMLEAFSD